MSPVLFLLASPWAPRPAGRLDSEGVGTLLWGGWGGCALPDSSPQPGPSLNLKHRELSYSIVGLWTAPLPGPPPLDSAVLANLFNDPYTTSIGLSPEGLLVQKLGKPPVPAVLIGPAKFQATHTSIDETVRVLDAFMAEAHKRMNQQIPLVSALGINSEIEWEKPAFSPSERWLADQYVRKGLALLPPDATVAATNVHFRLTLNAPERRTYNIQLQPRAGNENAVFASINDHREWNKAVPSGEEARRLLQESIDEIRNRVMPIVLGGVADA